MNIGGLECVVFPEAAALAGKPKAAVICCHGFGAPATDLVGLRDELVSLEPSLAEARFVFPAAPIDLSSTFGMPARAWWLIDMMAVQRLQTDPEALREFRKVEPEGMAKARSLLRATVDAVAQQTGLPYGRLILCGFSQGAMLSTDVALRLDEAPLGLGVLSGTLLIEDVWREKAKQRAGLKVFQSHGTQDPILPFVAAERLRDLFAESGFTNEFVPFRGGHTIGPEAFRAFGKWLASLL